VVQRGHGELSRKPGAAQPVRIAFAPARVHFLIPGEPFGIATRSSRWMGSAMLARSDFDSELAGAAALKMVMFA
jgi:hypothetical protein